MNSTEFYFAFLMKNILYKTYYSCKGAGSISTRSFGKAFKIAVR